MSSIVFGMCELLNIVITFYFLASFLIPNKVPRGWAAQKDDPVHRSLAVEGNWIEGFMNSTLSSPAYGAGNLDPRAEASYRRPITGMTPWLDWNFVSSPPFILFQSLLTEDLFPAVAALVARGSLY